MVADSANFSEATMFRFFSNKDEMLCETFLEVDRRMSNVFFDLFDPEKFEKLAFKDALFEIWEGIFSYLLSHKEETLYMIRFRYSALYTDEIRSKRMAYNGSFAKVYEHIFERNAVGKDTYQGFMLNYLFEMTLCFAEKVVTGRVQLSEEMKERLWNVIFAAAEAFCA
ncbi:MAG: TetR/AcrR family transcriptional regulator [Clostridia bacterium]|nr:TetR/AcrR family transcriptional regulator [Clostridia bacterium]